MKSKLTFSLSIAALIIIVQEKKNFSIFLKSLFFIQFFIDKMRFQPFESNDAKQLADSLKEAMSTDRNEFELLSTIRYDPALTRPRRAKGEIVEDETPLAMPVPGDANFFLLPYHWERLKFSIAFFEWPIDVPYHHLYDELEGTVTKLDPSRSYKLRVLVTREGLMVIEALAVAERNDLMSGFKSSVPPSLQNPQYSIYLDTQPSLVSPFTSFKTTKRDVYSAARQRMLPANDPGPNEVLLYNTRDMITEGSITNVAFLRNGQWVTPPITSGCLCGVVRHHLLSEGFIYEDEISRHSVKAGEKILVFNAIIGVCSGVIMDST